MRLGLYLGPPSISQTHRADERGSDREGRAPWGHSQVADWDWSPLLSDPSHHPPLASSTCSLREGLAFGGNGSGSSPLPQLVGAGHPAPGQAPGLLNFEGQRGGRGPGDLQGSDTPEGRLGPGPVLVFTPLRCVRRLVASCMDFSRERIPRKGSEARAGPSVPGQVGAGGRHCRLSPPFCF